MDHQEFQHIIQRYFRGQLVEEEYEILRSCLRDNIYREKFEQAKQAWNQRPELDESGNNNWARLHFKISSDKIVPTGTSTPVRKLWRRIAAVAAILVIGILAGGILGYLFVGQKTATEQLVFETPRGEKSMVTLPDGSQVWLNASSRLVYVTFSDKLRQVEMEGEAFFRIAKNANAPFVVKTDECEVEVLGTEFNVMAYEDFGRKEITLVSGQVKVSTADRQVMLKPGQSLDLKDNKFSVRDVNASLATGWVDNKFIFQNIPFSELISRLENWYDVDIEMDKSHFEDINFTGTFKNEETIWQVLDAIRVYTPITYDKTDLRKIKITMIK